MNDSSLGAYGRSSLVESSTYRSTPLFRDQSGGRIPLELSVPEDTSVASARSLSVTEEEYRSWISKHSQLALKLVVNGLTTVERKELILLRWMLDTAEESGPDPLGLLDDLVSERERLATEISAFVKTTKELTARAARR